MPTKIKYNDVGVIMRTLFMSEPRREFTGDRSNRLIDDIIHHAGLALLGYTALGSVIFGIVVGIRFGIRTEADAGWRPGICNDLCDEWLVSVAYSGLRCVTESREDIYRSAFCCDPGFSPASNKPTYQAQCEDYCHSHNISLPGDNFPQTDCAHHIASLCCDIGKSAIAETNALWVSQLCVGLWVITVLALCLRSSDDLLDIVPPLAVNEGAPLLNQAGVRFEVNCLNGDKKDLSINRRFLTIAELRQLVVNNFPGFINNGDKFVLQLTESARDLPWAICDAGYVYFENNDRITLMIYDEGVYGRAIFNAGVALVDSRVVANEELNADNVNRNVRIGIN
jgi:hypothetical protein